MVTYRDQTTLRRYTCLITCLLSCLVFITASVIGYFDERPFFIFTVCMSTTIITFLGTVCIFYTRFYLTPMYVVFMGGIVFGLYLTAQGGIAGNGSVVWLMLLPSLSILALGRKHGSIIFFIAYVALISMFLPAECLHALWSTP